MTAQQIERRIRALQQRAQHCREHGASTEALDDEIAELRAQLRNLGGPAGAERRAT